MGVCGCVGVWVCGGCVGVCGYVWKMHHLSEQRRVSESFYTNRR